MANDATNVSSLSGERSLKQIIEQACASDFSGVIDAHAFMKDVSRAISAVERYNFQAVLVQIAINGVQEANNQFGHDAGDAIVEVIGSQLSSQLRQTDAIGRVGGNDLGILLMHTTSELAQLKISQLATVIRSKPIRWNGEALNVSITYDLTNLEPRAELSDVLHGNRMRNQRRSVQVS